MILYEKVFFLFFLGLVGFVGCSNDDECYNEANSKLGNLVSPELFVTELNTNIPYSGILDIYPCVSELLLIMEIIETDS